MDVVVEILGRATFNDEFAVVASQTVTLADEAVTIVPEVPADAEGLDLRVRLQSPVAEIVHFKCLVLDGSVRPTSLGHYGSHGGVSQLFPFGRFNFCCSIVIARAGVALP